MVCWGKPCMANGLMAYPPLPHLHKLSIAIEQISPLASIHTLRRPPDRQAFTPNTVDNFPVPLPPMSKAGAAESTMIVKRH